MQPIAAEHVQLIRSKFNLGLNKKLQVMVFCLKKDLYTNLRVFYNCMSHQL